MNTLAAAMVKADLGRVQEVYDCFRPSEQRELMALLLNRAEVNERGIVLEVYALGGTHLTLTENVNPRNLVRTRPNWLPE